MYVRSIWQDLGELYIPITNFVYLNQCATYVGVESSLRINVEENLPYVFITCI